MVWLLFELHYLFDNTSILELHSCMTREQWRTFIFTVNSYRFNSLTVLCSASLCKFCTFLRLFVLKLFCDKRCTLQLFHFGTLCSAHLHRRDIPSGSLPITFQIQCSLLFYFYDQRRSYIL